MAKSPEEQQKTDATRIPEGGTGKLDERGAPRSLEPIHAESVDERNTAASPLDPELVETLRRRLVQEREAAIAELRTRGVSPHGDDAPTAGTAAALDEGDAAQASEREDLSLATRQRLAERINQLTAALERIAQGRYGICVMCGERIETNRLRAIPETEVCLEDQRRREGQISDAA
jgi:DnaK suppressor protein